MYETNLSNKQIDELYYGPGGIKELSPELKELFKAKAYYGPNGFKPGNEAYLQRQAYNPNEC
jgi:hypothetical protein